MRAASIFNLHLFWFILRHYMQRNAMVCLLSNCFFECLPVSALRAYVRRFLCHTGQERYSQSSLLSRNRMRTASCQQWLVTVPQQLCSPFILWCPLLFIQHHSFYEWRRSRVKLRWQVSTGVEYTGHSWYSLWRLLFLSS